MGGYGRGRPSPHGRERYSPRPGDDALSVELHDPLVYVGKGAPVCAPHVSAYFVLHWALLAARACSRSELISWDTHPKVRRSLISTWGYRARPWFVGGELCHRLVSSSG